MGWTHDDFVDGTTNTRSDIAGVLIETGAEASTPTPTASPASGLACGATVSFQVASVDLPVAEGCYQATEASYSTGGAFEVWSVSGTLDFGEVVVVGFTDDGTGEYVSQVPSVGRSWWALSFLPVFLSSVVLGPCTRRVSCLHASCLIGVFTILPLAP